MQEIILPGDVVAINVFYWHCDFVTGQADSIVAGVMETHLEAMYTELVAEIASAVVLGELRCYVREGLVWDLFKVRTPEVTFTNATDMLPQGVAALMRAYTEYPRVISRKYIPGFAEDSQVDGEWIASALTHLAAAAAVWVTTQEISAGNELVGGVWSTVRLDIAEFSGTEVIPVNPGYQRRRRPGVGM